MADKRVPRREELLWPMIEALRALGGSGSIAEIDEKLVEQQGFSEEVQSILHLDGPATELSYKLHWVRTYLKGMGMLENPRRAFWALTAEGRDAGPESIEPALAAYLADRKAARLAARQPGKEEPEPDDEAPWQDRLLEALLAMPPDAFERLCQRLLREAGFSRTQVTGRTGDGGIDGLGVYRVSLVSFQVFFQAKRWRGSVRAKDVRDFRGAMAGRGEKGLLITTGTFTGDAKKESTRDGAPPVDLVDGAALCALLVKYELGVRVRKRVEYDVEVDQTALDAI